MQREALDTHRPTAARVVLVVLLFSREGVEHSAREPTVACVRLGVGVGLIPDVGMYTLNKLLVYTQPAHLAVAEGVAPTETDLPIRRARFVRKVLESEVGRRG